VRRLLLLLCLAYLTGSAWAEPQFRIFTLQHRFGQDLLSAVKPLVGADGTASAVDNHLLIQAAPERISAIEETIARLDTELRMLRIRVKHHRITEKSDRALDVSGSARHGDVRVRLPQQNGRSAEGVRIDIRQSDTSVSENADEHLSVLEGRRAVIAVGKSVPFTEYWLVLSQRYAHFQQTIRYRDITTGFSVLPRPMGEEVEIEIMPRIAHLASDGVIEFQELATTVRVPRGNWVDLGGIMESRDEVSRAILLYGTEDKHARAELWVMVE
jgi:type II secretory pathway component GspD/PulD (secretin)